MAESKEEACFSPKIFTTNSKNGKRRPNKKTIIEDSIAKSMLSSIDANLDKSELFGGNIVHTSFDCPKNLREATKQAAKANGSSLCQILRLLMLAYVKSEYVKKHALSNTLTTDKPSIVIESLNSYQYVQNRPRRLNRQVEPQNITIDGLPKCEIGDCRNAAVDVLIYQPRGKEAKKYPVCLMHETKLLNERGTVWRLSK
jgi:hypothetical protein